MVGPRMRKKGAGGQENIKKMEERQWTKGGIYTEKETI